MNHVFNNLIFCTKVGGIQTSSCSEMSYKMTNIKIFTKSPAKKSNQKLFKKTPSQFSSDSSWKIQYLLHFQHQSQNVIVPMIAELSKSSSGGTESIVLVSFSITKITVRVVRDSYFTFRIIITLLLLFINQFWSSF